MPVGSSEVFKSFNAYYPIWFYGFSLTGYLSIYSTGCYYEVFPTAADHLSCLPGPFLVSQNCLLEKNKDVHPAKRKKDVFAQPGMDGKAEGKGRRIKIICKAKGIQQQLLFPN
jgi:hypothetical protein